MNERARLAPSRRMARLRDLSLAVFAVATLAFAGYAVRSDDPPPDSHGGATLPRQSATAPPTSSKTGPMTSLWFGDSIVAGCCRTLDSSPSMAQVAAKALGWQAPRVEGFRGTGYTTKATVDGVEQPAYVDNIGRYVTGKSYRVVIVAGGNNDAAPGFSPEAFRAAVRSTLAQVKEALPDAKLVVVGPYSPTGTGYADQRTIEREEAARAGARFIDGIAQGWFRGQQGLTYRDGFHPNDAGQAYLGARLAADLGKLARS